jgi:hypothetical protein
MKTTLAGLLFLLTAAAASASGRGPAIASWIEKVELAADGGAVVSVRFEPGAARPLLPCALPNPSEAYLLKGGRRVPASIEERGGAKFIKQPTRPGAAPDGYGYSSSGLFDPAQAAARNFGDIEVKYQFANTTGEKIEKFRAELLLPQGMIVNAVADFQPKAGKNDAADPYWLSMDGGRRAAGIRASGLKSGDRAELRFDMKREKRPAGVWVILLLAAVLYLFGFHDILSDTPRSSKAAQAPHEGGKEGHNG